MKGKKCSDGDFKKLTQLLLMNVFYVATWLTYFSIHWLIWIASERRRRRRANSMMEIKSFFTEILSYDEFFYLVPR